MSTCSVEEEKGKLNNSSFEVKNGKNPIILFINPPYYRLYKKTYSYNRYPLSLGYLATEVIDKTRWRAIVYNTDFAVPSESWRVSFLSGKGFERHRRILNNLSHPIWREIDDKIRNVKPNAIGINCCAATSRAAAIIAAKTKELNRETTVIIGGSHPTLIGRSALLDCNIDIVVKGEGEQSIIDLLNQIQGDKKLEAVKGIIFKRENSIVETPNREPIANLDSLKFPHKYAKKVLLDFEKYPLSAFNAILATRGCPHNCFFCESKAVFGRKPRFRSPTNVTSEINSLRRKGLNSFEFIDDTFGINKEYLSDLCQKIVEECPKIKWICNTRVDLIDEKTVKLMKKAGCAQIAIGLESGNNEMLQKMRKGTTVEDTIKAAKLVKKNGIAIRLNLLLGLPMETNDTLDDTLRVMGQIEGRFCYSSFTPYPGSEAFNYCKNAGLVDDTVDYSLFNHQSPENNFCPNVEKNKFEKTCFEIQKYVDQVDAKEDFKQLFSPVSIYKLLNFGTLRNRENMKNFAQSAIAEFKLILRNLVNK
jgi:anaerobic magnesium-protoporphyrin IX monomethyl ester cyclase